MRVLVCGGRDYEDRDVINKELRALADEHGLLVVIEGGDGYGRPKIRGADSLAREWATYYLHGLITEMADWHAHGTAAGPIRNSKMLTAHKPDLVLAFPSPVRGLEGTGTGDMVQRARDAGVEVRVIGLEKEGLGLC